MLRAVLDTNVLISAIISDGKPRELLKKGTANQFSIVTSNLILKELITVLRRPKFKTPEDEIQKIIIALLRSSEVIKVKSKFTEVKEDPKDDMIINTAHDGRADVIVSGDNHLLELKNFRGIKIITVDCMLKTL